MAEACTTTEVTTVGTVKKITWSWTSAADGSVGSVAGATTTAVLDGKVMTLCTVPAGAADAPDDNYDITITDADGVDVLCGAGANRDTANIEVVADASLGAVAGSVLKLNVTNAGDGNKGTATIWVR